MGVQAVKHGDLAVKDRDLTIKHGEQRQGADQMQQSTG